MSTRHFMCAMTHPLYLLQTKHAKTLHFFQPFCRRVPPLATIQPPRAHPLNMTKRINLVHATQADYNELEIAKALASHSVEICLPKHYAPNHLVPDGKMRVVGVKAKKISSKKAVLIVKFISLSSLENVLQIQLFCISLEPKTK